MTASASEFAPAKINLALHVTARAANGYHHLDSLVAFARLGDRLRLEPADHDRLEITGPFSARLPADGSNLVLKALAALRAECGAELIPRFSVSLVKTLPVASGIGGGSADAAAILRAAIRQSGVTIDQPALQRLALSLGADVPVCLTSRSCRMTGIGEVIEPVAGLPAVCAVFANPLKAVSTAAVFNKLGLGAGETAGSDLPALPPEGWRDAAGLASWLAATRNDLQAPAIAQCPEIADVLDALGATPGALMARMSGSGATCFALFADAQSSVAAARTLARRHRGWWVRPARLGGTQ